ncbi:putative metal-dependent hydrolase [Nymphaea thermarum]|nr:putative metal-dependent hydrolase [Nymphaea thermarum]
MAVRLFDAHCHLQDPRIIQLAPQLIDCAVRSGVVRFAVNGISEKDWHLVKQMGEQYDCVVPSFGLHPWFVEERTTNWLTSLRDLFRNTPEAAVGEIGLDKGSRGKQIDFTTQVEVFREQLELAKELGKPVSVHCVRAFGDLQEILQSLGPFPAGVILHSYLGSAEMVPGLAKLGAYFSFSGFLTSMDVRKAKKMLKSVPTERILLETDAPDALPQSDMGSLKWVPGDANAPPQLEHQGTESRAISNKALNHPANIFTVLNYVASMLEIPAEELAETSYSNAQRLFSYPGSAANSGHKGEK